MTSSVYAARRVSAAVAIENRDCRVVVGGANPVVVQSMTNTATEDVGASVAQIAELASAGSELVRLTVNTPDAARAVPQIRAALDAAGLEVPLVGDFHYNGHKLLAEFPDCARALSKYRINPGNVGKGVRHEDNFASMVETAVRYGKAVRIGVNGGSLDKELLSRLMDANRALASPKDVHEVWLDAVVESAAQSAETAQRLGLAADRIVLSTKVSDVADLIAVNRRLAQRGPWALHLGLTEAGIGTKGIVASSAALAVLLSEGIGDTIRVSITPAPGKARTEEVRVAQELLQTMGLRSFMPLVVSCPGCGRTTSTLFQELAALTQQYLLDNTPRWREYARGFENMTVAVMGCVVNGPGESKHANIGISLPGAGEAPNKQVYADGVKIGTIKGHAGEASVMAEEFHKIIDRYVEEHFVKKDKFLKEDNNGESAKN